MKTISFCIANYCVPCHAFCRYCLLSSCGRSTGVNETDGMAFAHRVMHELAEARPELNTYYYVGYSMDTPRLAEYINFCREHRCPSADFLQMNGFAFRDDRELKTLMETIRSSGVELIDLTFFGTLEYHDRFAGRKGDFDFLLRMLASAIDAGLRVNASVPLIRENLGQMPELYRILSEKAANRITFFLPHSEGRGKNIQDQRITREEFEALPGGIRNSFERTKHLTEAEWLSGDEIVNPEKRVLTLVLTPENYAHFSAMPATDILNELENIDDRYLEQMPSAKELAALYGDSKNRQLFRLRDLLLKWRQQYISDTGNTIYDMDDESHHCARRL